MFLTNYFKPKKASKAIAHSEPKLVESNQTMTPALSEKTNSIINSGYPSGTSTPRSVLSEGLKHDVMCNYIHSQQLGHQWIHDRTGENQGVLIRKKIGSYSGAPATLVQSRFAANCASLNLQCAMTVDSRVVELFLRFAPRATSVPLKNGLRIQVLPCLEDLCRARKAHSAAFIAEESLLVVWDDDATNLVSRAKSIEDDLIEIVWKEEFEESADGKQITTLSIEELDEESGEARAESRPIRLMSAFGTACTIVILMAMIGSGLRETVVGVLLDHNYARLAVLCYLPIQCFFALFFCQIIVNGLIQLIGPVKRIDGNSELYSGSPPKNRLRGNLPHVTIQCPVYKEGLQSVIAPTVKSIKAAISTYELQGGTASIFYNDDGMQIISEEEREARRAFYHDHSIGWVARPGHGKDGFQRAGKFKKASNMNFALNVSSKVEAKMENIDRDENWTQNHEEQAYQNCLQEVLAADPRAWGSGDIRIGDYILIIDSDTRVPVDCLLDAVTEMEQSPQVAILQFSSGVMQVVNTFFENGITYFTNLIYGSIAFVVSNGDYAPFVGHNAILRWSAVQQVSDPPDEDGYECFWSEKHVSEDFDMALRLQIEGYIIRYATWAGQGFKEGVSLTVYDELARWEKYAYGCDELLFNPLKDWIFKGPITPLFRKFFFSKLRIQGKLGIMSYIGTYYALGASWLLTLVNYFCVGWFNGYLDKFYVDSWKILISVVVVFSAFAPIALAVMRYRTGSRSFFSAYLESMKWLPLMTIFFGGISLHLSRALLCHLFSIPMSWGATSKEADNSNFFLELPKIFKNFRGTLFFGLACVIGMIILAEGKFIPYTWNITQLIAIFPLALVASCHILLPIALNPALMTFSW